MTSNNNSDTINGTACIITGGLLDTIHAKTTHGLLRTSTRFDIKGVIDHKFAGRDAGEFLDGKQIGIKIYSSIEEMLQLAA